MIRYARSVPTVSSASEMRLPSDTSGSWMPRTEERQRCLGDDRERRPRAWRTRRWSRARWGGGGARRSAAPAHRRRRAASTYSFSRNDRYSPRTIRAIGIQARMLITMIMPLTVGRGWKVDETEERRVGVAGHDEQHGERRQHEDEIGEAHQQLIDPAAVVPGERPDDHADHHRDERDPEPDLQRLLERVQHAGELVAAELVGTTEVLPRGRLSRTLEGGGVQLRVELVRRDHVREQRHPAQDDEDEQRDHRELVTEEAPADEPPLGTNRFAVDGGVLGLQARRRTGRSSPRRAMPPGPCLPHALLLR